MCDNITFSYNKTGFCLGHIHRYVNPSWIISHLHLSVLSEIHKSQHPRANMTSPLESAVKNMVQNIKEEETLHLQLKNVSTNFTPLWQQPHISWKSCMYNSILNFVFLWPHVIHYMNVIIHPNKIEHTLYNINWGFTNETEPRACPKTRCQRQKRKTNFCQQKEEDDAARHPRANTSKASQVHKGAMSNTPSHTKGMLCYKI